MSQSILDVNIIMAVNYSGLVDTNRNAPYNKYSAQLKYMYYDANGNQCHYLLLYLIDIIYCSVGTLITC